eukprot:Gb_28522 [translate_table: standard]
MGDAQECLPCKGRKGKTFLDCILMVSLVFQGSGYFPKGIDIYFENVGGEMLEAVLENMNVHGRIAVCGMISQYNQEGGKWIKNAIQLLIKCIKFEGFLEPDYSATYPEFVEKARDHLKEGKIICLEDIAEGLESAPSAFVGLFQGKNIGKQLVRICAE